MKKEKGEAAFNSVDDVLADRIINTTEKHGQDEDPSNLDSASNCSFDTEIQEPAETGRHHGKSLIIAICAGIVLLIIGILMFRCKKCCCKK